VSTTLDSVVSQEHIDAFRRDGFVVIPDLLTPEEVDRYSEAVTHGVKDRTRDDTTPMEEKSNYQKSFVQCMNLWEDKLDVRPLTFHPRLGQAAAELMGVDAVRLWHDQALYKKAGGRKTDAHQDHPYWPIKEVLSCTAWIPFEDTTIDSGTLGYLPGTHDVGLRKFVNIFFGEPENILEDPEVAGVEPVYPGVKKGGVAFHHGLTVHLAGPNVTDRDRAVHTIIYFPDGSTRGYPNTHFAVDRGGIDVGQKIDSDVTPVIWPRPEGDLPPTPKTPFFLDIPNADRIINTGAIPRPDGK
jgi:ectoine hydroxylase-related dioxygenase (phytanoyl-CoA dioxygenase family)